MADDEDQADEISYPTITGPVHVYHSATATFYSPSDISGIRGMCHECICATPSWHGYPQYDCTLAVVNQHKPGFHGMNAVQVLLFFSFRHNGDEFPCTLVHWFNTYRHSPDPKTGLWIVRPDSHGATTRRTPILSIIHVDTLLRGTHLLPIFGSRPLPHNFHHSCSLDCFEAFYINHYTDHHMHEIVFKILF